MYIQELSPADAKLPIMNQAQAIFITYFIDLYKNIPVESLGIHNLTEYLNTIFQNTKIALYKGEVYAFLVYIVDQPAGFAVCSICEDLNMILIRTIPIALKYKNQEHTLRHYIFTHIKNKFFKTPAAIMLVRKANTAYRSFCENAGFIKNNNLFAQSDYLQKTYNSNWYDIYEKKIN